MTAAPLEIQFFHHKSDKWIDYIREYSDVATLEAAGTISVTRGSLPGANNDASFAQLPEALRRLLFFGKPDVVICLDDGIRPVRPIFALDVTEHVSAADHWMQRFPNLVGCAQEGVPGAFVTPGDMPARANFVSAKQPNFYFLFDRVIEIHQTPLYIAEWPSSDGKGLDGDAKYHDLPPHGSEGMAHTLNFLNLVLERAVKGQDFRSLMRERLVINLRSSLRAQGYRKLPQIGDFGRLKANMPDNRMLSGPEMSSWLADRSLGLPSPLPERISKRESYLIFAPRIQKESSDDRREAMLKRIAEKGGDPYGPQPLVFDYMFCRLGPSKLERDSNVVIDLSFLEFSDFAEWIQKIWVNSPVGSTSYDEVASKMAVYSLHLTEPLIQVVKNFVRWQIFAADLIVFKDGVIAF